MTEKKKKSGLIIILIIVGTFGIVGFCMIGLLVAIAVPGFIRARDTSRRNACWENQVKLDSAAQVYMLDNNLEQLSDTPFAGADLDSPSARILTGDNSYLKGVPMCPAGGTYSFLSTEGTLNETVMCDHDGNLDGILDHPFPGN